MVHQAKLVLGHSQLACDDYDDNLNVVRSQTALC